MGNKIYVFGLFGFVNAQDWCMGTGPTSDLDTTLGPVSISGDSGSGFTSEIYCGEGLNDLYGTHSVTLVIGKSYSITWGGDSCGNQFFKEGRMWVDWKSAGWMVGENYDDIALGPVVEGQGSFVETTNFDVPDDAKNGFTRMRGMVIEDTDQTKLQPCHHFAFGGTTDFKVEVISKSGGGGGLGGGSGGGLIFLIILLVGVFVYCVGGFVFNMKKREKKGAEAIPNVEFWKDFPNLVKEGCLFTFRKAKSLKKGDGGYSTFEDV